MARYIDANLAKEIMPNEAIIIDNIPTADVVEVVRCKDCKHAYINSFSALSGTAVCNIMARKRSVK